MVWPSVSLPLQNLSAPASLPAIGTHAQPLRLLDFLIYEEFPAALLYDAGLLVNVPSPARYAIHELIVAQRHRTGAAKVESPRAHFAERRPLILGRTAYA